MVEYEGGDPPSGSTETDAVMTSLEDAQARALWSASRSIDAQLSLEAERRPTAFDTIAKIKDFLEKKHYHELSDELFAHILEDPCNLPVPSRQPSSDATGQLPHVVDTMLYVVRPLMQHLNPHRVMSLLRMISERIDPSDGLRLAQDFRPLQEEDSDAAMMCDILTAYLSIDVKGKIIAAEDLLDSVEAKLQDKLGVALDTHGAYHRTKAKLALLQGNSDMFYQHAKLYISYVSLDSLSEENREELAFQMSIEALCAENVYGFGELLQEPLLKSLEGKETSWVLKLLYIFREGDLRMFGTFCEDYADKFGPLEKLGQNKTFLRKKLTILAFLDLCFRRPKDRLTFEDTAKHCQVPIDEVELITMEALSKGLVKGRINQVSQAISISWVKPRILDSGRLDVMHQRLLTWASGAESLLTRLEELSPELLVGLSTIF